MSELESIDEKQARKISLLTSCYTPNIAKFMNSSNSSRYFSAFTKFLTRRDFANVILALLKMITQEFFDNLHTDQQTELVEKLYQILGYEDSELAEKAKLILNQLSLSSFHILPILKANVVSKGDESKKIKTEKNTADSLSNLFTCFLEILDSKQNIENRQDLVSPLFDILKGILDMEFNLHEYMKQLLLSIINDIVSSLNRLNLTIDSNLIHIDTFLQCIRVTDNVQSHNFVFDCLSSVTCMHPELVLTSVMPIFTFMGTNVLRQDDDFSFFIIKKTIMAIVPTLVRDGIMQKELQGILDVFLNALHHIPRHRRLPIYKILI